ncbi:hypothetical protein SaccyDRAFT_4333 [Saccharomonospora cyanea NA-134]|uniref:Uncharacterized protein n=1 Tax=Saccharomonospora cyanea NA-134 TaxID=882082 RepID=H5XM69_9PSEU|nr:hypothetical protein SaccyDRAFT_4333 [Saccharomonospora cyanea NA-134]
MVALVAVTTGRFETWNVKLVVAAAVVGPELRAHQSSLLARHELRDRTVGRRTRP